MKLCINCKHYKADDYGYPALSKCGAPQNKFRLNIITGEREPIYRSCSSHRIDGIFFAILTHNCGKRGRWYEPAVVESKQ